MTKVVIGVDPHKRLNAVVVLNHRGEVLARRQFANTSDGFRELATFSHRWRPRTWAIEGCNGVGKHVARARRRFETAGALAAVHIQAGNGRFADDRRTVRRHIDDAAPVAQHAHASKHRE